MPALNTQLSKTCPACGGQGHAEARLPFTSTRPSQPQIINLDNTQAVVDKLSTSSLLALIECLPYKQFTCSRCGQEFKLQSQSGKEQLFAMLSSMQPEAQKAPARRRKATTPTTIITPPSAPVGATSTAARPAIPKPGSPVTPPAAKPSAANTKPVAPEWEPYHLEHDLDSLFDQFDETNARK
jgi:hypothetical protein